MTRAVLFDQFGEPTEVLGVHDVPELPLGKGEVRVRMLASPVNPSDLMMIRGVYGALPELPATPGYEGVGVVEESGGGLLGRFLVGKRVAVMNRKTGNWRERTVIPAKQAIPLPNSFPLDQAAMFFVNPAAAFVMTRRLLCVPAGAWLLQTAAGSAVGRMVIRLGKRYGFRTINVVRREEQVEELQSLGGDAVVHFDPASNEPGQLRDEVLRMTNGDGVPFVIDPVGGAVGSAAASCLGKYGRMLMFGSLSPDSVMVSPRELIGNGAAVEGFWLTNYMDRQKIIGKLKLVRQLRSLLEDGTLTSEVGERFGLESICDAVRHAEIPGHRGKVLLDISAVS